MGYEQNTTKAKHPVVIAVANKAAEILHSAISPLWLKSQTDEEITPADIKFLDNIIGVLKDLHAHADMSGEFSNLTTEQLIEKTKELTKV